MKISQLPQELLVHILQLLPVRHLFNPARLINREFYHLITGNNFVWKNRQIIFRKKVSKMEKHTLNLIKNCRISSISFDCVTWVEPVLRIAHEFVEYLEFGKDLFGLPFELEQPHETSFLRDLQFKALKRLKMNGSNMGYADVLAIVKSADKLTHLECRLGSIAHANNSTEYEVIHKLNQRILELNDLTHLDYDAFSMVDQTWIIQLMNIRQLKSLNIGKCDKNLWNSISDRLHLNDFGVEACPDTFGTDSFVFNDTSNVRLHLRITESLLVFPNIIQSNITSLHVDEFYDVFPFANLKLTRLKKLTMSYVLPEVAIAVLQTCNNGELEEVTIELTNYMANAVFYTSDLNLPLLKSIYSTYISLPILKLLLKGSNVKNLVLKVMDKSEFSKYGKALRKYCQHLEVFDSHIDLFKYLPLRSLSFLKSITLRGNGDNSIRWCDVASLKYCSSLRELSILSCSTVPNFQLLSVIFQSLYKLYELRIEAPFSSVRRAFNISCIVDKLEILYLSELSITSKDLVTILKSNSLLRKLEFRCMLYELGPIISELNSLPMLESLRIYLNDSQQMINKGYALPYLHKKLQSLSIYILNNTTVELMLALLCLGFESFSSIHINYFGTLRKIDSSEIDQLINTILDRIQGISQIKKDEITKSYAAFYKPFRPAFPQKSETLHILEQAKQKETKTPSPCVLSMIYMLLFGLMLLVSSYLLTMEPS